MSGYRYISRYEWVTYETPAPASTEEGAEAEPFEPLEGSGEFRARILANPTGAQVRHEQKMLEALGKDGCTEEEYLAAVAERVSDWNLEAETESGEWAPYPAPAQHADFEAIAEAFYRLPPHLFRWLLSTMRLMHLPKLRTRVLTSASTSATSTAAAGDSNGLPAT